MTKWRLVGLLLSVLFVATPGHAFNTTAVYRAILVRDAGTDFLENPFIQKCFSTSAKSPTLSLPQVQVQNDDQTGQRMYTVKFNGTSLEPRMILSDGQIVALDKTSNKSGYVLSILRSDAEGFTTRLQLKNQNGDDVEYRLNISSTGATFQEYLTDAQARGVCIRNQIWAGVGISALAFDQKVTGLDASAKFTTLTPGSYHVDGRYYLSPEWGIIASFKSSPGKIKSTGASPIDSVSFDRKIYELGFQYRNFNVMKRWRDHLFYPYLRIGYQVHDVPAIFMDDGGASSLTSFNMQQGAVGIGVNVFNRHSMFYETYFNIKYPLLSSAQNLSPKLHFDGAVGVGKALTPNLNVGLFWHGHFDQFEYSIQRNGYENRGETTILFGNVDLRIGWMF